MRGLVSGRSGIIDKVTLKSGDDGRRAIVRPVESKCTQLQYCRHSLNLKTIEEIPDTCFVGSMKHR